MRRCGQLWLEGRHLRLLRRFEITCSVLGTLVKRKRKQPARPTRDEDFEAFCRALPELLKTNPGLFVAFSGGQLVDKDPDEFALAERVAREHAGQRVLIQPVIESGLMEVYMETPQLTGTPQLEMRIRESLAEPAESLTLEQFRAKMQKIATEPGRSTAPQNVIRLSDKDAAFIASLLENRPPPNRMLREAFESSRASIRDKDSGPPGNVKPSEPIKSEMRTTTTRKKSKLPPDKRKPPRCKHVLVILENRLEVVELLAEETHAPPPGDFPDDGPHEFAVVRYQDVVVHVPIDSVLFLEGIPALEIASQLVHGAGGAIEGFKADLSKILRAERKRSKSRLGLLSSAMRRNKLAGEF
jgi:hypothetical protein